MLSYHMRPNTQKNGLTKWNIKEVKEKTHIEESLLTERKNQLYPIFLKLDQLETLLVGAGNVGLEKLQSLLSNSPEAKVTVVALELKDEVRRIISEHPSCRIIQGPFREYDLDNKHIVICATDNNELHKQIKSLAREKGILVNVAD